VSLQNKKAGSAERQTHNGEKDGFFVHSRVGMFTDDGWQETIIMRLKA
jgi:hypothetical protein